MLKCRKNFANLLLLSVMLFALGASVKPIDCGAVAGTLLAETSSAQNIQWVNHSGAVVYRGQQLAATAGEEFSWKPVNPLEELLIYSISCQQLIVKVGFGSVWNGTTHSSRAPPAVFFYGFYGNGVNLCC